MRAKLGTAATLLIVVLMFGGTGVFATYEIVTMLYDGARAREWTAVQADAVSERSYRYRFDGRDYESDRWGLERLGGSDNIDTWYRDMSDRVRSAFKEHRPITVYVNPADPSQAMIDRDIRWKQVLLFVPFAVCFGGIGLGALWMAPGVLRDSPDKDKPQPQAAPAPARTVASDVRGGLVGSWVFAVFWNALSMPVAVAFVPDALRAGEWLALLILIFPFVGLLLLWYAINSTIGYLRHGSATLNVLTAEPRPGAPLQGSIAFARGVSAGDPFRVELECLKVESTSNKISTTTFWSKECAVQAAPAPAGAHVDFRFDVPASVPPTSTDASAAVRHKWRIQARPAAQHMAAAYGFDVALLPSAASEDEFTLANDAPVPDAVKAMFERLGVNASKAKQRAAFAELPPDEQQALAKFAHRVPSMKTIVIVIICIVTAIQFGPVILDLIRLVRGQG